MGINYGVTGDTTFTYGWFCFVLPIPSCASSMTEVLKWVWIVNQPRHANAYWTHYIGEPSVASRPTAGCPSCLSAGIALKLINYKIHGMLQTNQLCTWYVCCIQCGCGHIHLWHLRNTYGCSVATPARARCPSSVLPTPSCAGTTCMNSLHDSSSFSRSRNSPDHENKKKPGLLVKIWKSSLI